MTISSNLASGARRALRAAAHHLDPVVMIGEKGLTASVLHEIDIALTAHALIKVRVAVDDREQRLAFMNEICEKLGCESVQHLGKLLVLWRNREDGSGVEEFIEDEPPAVEVNTARGPRKRLPNSDLRRPTARDPRPREGANYAARRSAARPAGAGARFNQGENGYAPRDGQGFASRGGNERFGGRAPSRGRAPAVRGLGRSDENRGAGGYENRRYRRSDDTPAPDTRPPREGWAPRGRRGAQRHETNAGEARFPRSRSSGDRFGGGSHGGFNSDRTDRTDSQRFEGGETRRAPAPRGRSPRTSGASDFTGARPPRSGRPPASGGRWGERGGAAGGGSGAGNAGALPKPRARRRLG
jgi:RNA-binding protein